MNWKFFNKIISTKLVYFPSLFPRLVMKQQQIHSWRTFIAQITNKMITAANSNQYRNITDRLSWWKVKLREVQTVSNQIQMVSIVWRFIDYRTHARAMHVPTTRHACRNSNTHRVWKTENNFSIEIWARFTIYFV